MYVIKYAVAFFVSAFLILAAYSYQVSALLFDEKLDSASLDQAEIAPIDEALTFARAANKLLLVVGHEAGYIKAIDLSARFGALDPISLYQDQGYDRFVALVEQGLPSEKFPIEILENPVNYGFPNVAVGTNYAEHAEEVYLDDPPFLFPKLSEPGRWNDSVSNKGSSRLDFEAELCIVPLHDIKPSSGTAKLGLVLCNDYTDRMTLIKQLKLSLPMGETGFAAAKGKKSFLPTGYLFLIPRSDTFYERITLELYVNGHKHQHFSAKDMILKPNTIIKQTFGSLEKTYYSGTTPMPLLSNDRFAAGSLILTGTAAGVLFKPVNIWNPSFYLATGDRVVTRATYLGHLDNSVN